MPPTPFAVKVEDLATPSVSVTSVSVAVPLAKVPLAPEAGAVNVTFSPAVKTPAVVTVAVRDDVNGLPLAALCAEPLTAVSPTTWGGPPADAGFELSLPQPIRKPRGRQINAKAFRFMNNVSFRRDAGRTDLGQQTIPVSDGQSLAAMC